MADTAAAITATTSSLMPSSTTGAGTARGTAAGWTLCRIFDQLGTFGKLVFHFPFVPVFVFAALLLVIQMVFSVWAVRYCGMEPLIQRIKSE